MNNSPGRFINSPKIALAIIAGVWLVMQVVAWYHFGVKTGVDTALYVADARAILDGTWNDIGSPFHVGYSLLLAVVIATTGDFTNVVVFQLVLSLLAMLSVYRLTFAFSESRFAAFFAALLFAVWPDVSQWNFIVYTDSVFMDLVLISITILHFTKRRWHYVLASLLIVFTIFIRPVGVVFFLSLLVYLYYKMSLARRVRAELSHEKSLPPRRVRDELSHEKSLPHRRVRAELSYEKSLPPQRGGNPLKRIIITALFLVIGLVVINFVLHDSIDYFLSSYMKAEIIYPDVNLGISPPSDLWIPGTQHQPVIRLFLFVLNNPIYFLKLFFVKIALFAGHVKPYFSLTHNLLIGMFLYPLYVLAAFGVRSLPGNALRNFTLTFIIFQIIMVGFTSENWDGRFLLPVLPWVFILSSVGIFRILKDRSLWTVN